MITRIVLERVAKPGEVNLVVSQGNASLEELIAAIPDAGKSIGFSHGTTDLDYARYFKTFGDTESLKKIQQQTRCCDCNQEPLNPHITNCNHIYCLACMEALQNRSARLGRDGARCVNCNELFTSVTPCKELETTADAEEVSETPNTILRKVKPEKTSLNKWIRMKGAVAPSSKTMAMKTQVLGWLKDDPDVKIIIYSQFIPLLHIIGKVCEGERWTYRRYQGDMTLDARDRAVRDFGHPELKIQILLASLKCGGLGLNLTAASRVLIMDSWWNDSVEQQAFCRVFRHGQDKTTELTRLVVKGTIDEDMMNLKNRKLQEINPVLEDERATKPTLKELVRLFGSADENGDGTEFIFPGIRDAFAEDDHLRVIDYDSEDEYREMGNDP
ncbi:hypothetical protein AMS68_004693 [Peltaster fructicola]|uniref:Helicase C-terminal domain-containing protein n=1 Tax=Peltaster fructicola TaxID=286661 RepID=A0A6H0XWW6_9PEZI|nr:hypothetical protein AMS68_004693 [Peltaster fructicola]